MTVLRWDGLEANSVERCSVKETPSGVTVVSEVRGTFGSCQYTLTAAGDWRFRSLRLTSRGRSLNVDVDVDVDGTRWRVDGAERRDLVAAREVDLAISPLSNTLPIRRLGLAMGESSDIVTAYVTVPECAVRSDPQRYTRLSDREYLYESLDSDFARVISVDERGLVTNYPGLFTRSET